MEKKDQKISLAVETSGKTMSAALLNNAHVMGEIFIDAGPRHSDILADTCRFLLESCGVRIEELKRIAVCTGPGSFTGLRVGLSFARTLAQSLKIPLIGVPVFEILARQAAPENVRAKKIMILIPSIGDDVYVGVFRPGSSRPLGRYRVAARKKIERELAREPRGKISLIEEGSIQPRAGILGALALERGRGKKGSWQEVLPLYLRPSIAQERKEYRKTKS